MNWVIQSMPNALFLHKNVGNWPMLPYLLGFYLHFMANGPWLPPKVIPAFGQNHFSKKTIIVISTNKPINPIIFLLWGSLVLLIMWWTMYSSPGVHMNFSSGCQSVSCRFLDLYFICYLNNCWRTVWNTSSSRSMGIWYWSIWSLSWSLSLTVKWLWSHKSCFWSRPRCSNCKLMTRPSRCWGNTLSIMSGTYGGTLLTWWSLSCFGWITDRTRTLTTSGGWSIGLL